MGTTQLLDSLPILGVFVAFALVSLLCYEVGFRFGRWWQDREPGEQEGPTGLLVGSILALLAFLLAVTMGMASDRFDTRRGIVLDEANSIGTTYLRAGYLPEPASSEIRELLREYVPLRIVVTDVKAVQLAADIQRSQEILTELWAISEQVAKTTDQGDLVSLYLDSLNETIDLNETRITAGLYARVPETVLLLLVAGSALSLAMVGYSAGLTKRRGFLNADRLDRRPWRGAHARGRPRSAAGGVHPGQPAAADRPPATDRAAVTLRAGLGRRRSPAPGSRCFRRKSTVRSNARSAASGR